MTRTNQLRRSSTRLQRQGALWFQQTLNAGEIFLAESRAASVTFAQDIRGAGTRLVTTVGTSAGGFRKALHKEVLDWRSLALKTREAYVAALEERLRRAERQAMSTRQALTADAVETTVLRSAQGLLERAQSRVDERLAQAAKPAAAKAARKTTAAKPKAAKAPTEKGQIPLRNYDQLTAKDVVSRLQRLSGPQATAVLDYERAQKKRATVIRAAEQRLGAAG
jgi:hypothetical protein